MAVIIGSQIFAGNNIAIGNGRVIIDGKDVTGDLPEQKIYNIEVQGNCEFIKADVCQKITVHGNSGPISTQSGDVEAGNVSGSVSTMSGDVDCGTIGGSVSTMSGDIKHRKN